MWRLLSLSLLLAGAAASLPAAPLRIIAFGDSITLGYGDTSPQAEGYPGRLQRWLRERAYDATVVNSGVGGETTAEGLSRVDSVLADGGDYFLLMEGTNDISRGSIGIETIRFNLDQMATRAEAAGMVAVHATVIPRLPTATSDANNARTSALAVSLRALADLRGRPLVDQFALFQSLPNVFLNYYNQDPDDQVGHPNGAGYTELAGHFLEHLLELLATPRLEILPPAGAVEAGALAEFSATLFSSFVRLEWDFGDGGWAASTAPLVLAAQHVFLEPGSHVVTLRGETAGGGVATDQVTLVVGGEAPLWIARSTLLPILLHAESGLPGDVVSELRIQNFGASLALAEAVFFPEVRYDQPPAPRRVLVPPGTARQIVDVIPSLFGLERARGALLLIFRAPTGAATDQIVSFANVALAADPTGSSTDVVEELAATRWSSSQKVIGGIGGGVTTAIELVAANLDLAGGYVQLELYDGLGALVDAALYELGPLEIRWRSITDLYRGLESRPQPFTAVFRAAGVRFAAAALSVDPLAGQVVYLPSSP